MHHQACPPDNFKRDFIGGAGNAFSSFAARFPHNFTSDFSGDDGKAFFRLSISTK